MGQSSRQSSASWFVPLCRRLVVLCTMALMFACGGDGGGESPPDDGLSDVGGDAEVVDSEQADVDEPDAPDVLPYAPDVLDAAVDIGDTNPGDTDPSDVADVLDTGDASDSDTAADVMPPDADAGTDVGDVGDAGLDVDASADADATDVGSDADADAGCEENVCGGCEALQWRGDSAEPGDPCEAACGPSTLVCDGLDSLICEETGTNACGGCEALDEPPGRPCSPATDEFGVFLCTGPDSVECFDASTNRCGGTAALSAVPGSACGECLAGVWSCDGRDTVVCEEAATPRNLCGGCAPLEGEPGEACDECGGVWACDDDGAAFCERADNLCGGCASLEAEPGTPCPDDGLWVCDGRDAVVCTPDAVGGCDPAFIDGDGLGSPCGPCGDGRLQCSGPLSVCTFASEPNSCGGCGFAPGEVGERCAAGARWRCEDTALVCRADPLAIGDRCVEDADCASGFCTDVRWNSEARVCAEFCVPGEGMLCPEGQSCYALQLDNPSPCEEECAGLTIPDLFFCLGECLPPATDVCLPDALCVDEDADGFGVVGGCLFDCDDSDARRNIGAAETCDGVDNDCDGAVDEPDDGELGCGPASRCEEGTCVAIELCVDGEDNDGDSLVDCDDPGCESSSSCLPDGPCTSDEDLAVIDDASLLGSFPICLINCLTLEDPDACIADCTAARDALSTACGDCFDSFATCSTTECADLCDPAEAACTDCYIGCYTEFRECGGITSLSPCIGDDEPCDGPRDDTPAFVCDEVAEVCRRRCDPDDEEPCASGRDCRPASEFSDPGRVEGGVCLPSSCGSTARDTVCDESETCLVTSGASFCEEAGDGIVGDTCEEDLECGPGLLCFLSRCVEPCDVETAGGFACDGEEVCYPVFERAARNQPGVCAVPCSPYSSGECPDGEACVPNRDEVGALIAFTCQARPLDAPDVGEACDPALGCAEGSICRRARGGGFECVEFCDSGGAEATLSGCPGDQLCIRQGPRSFGTCQDACDPYPRDGACGEGFTCREATIEGRYAPNAGVCILDEFADGLSEGEPCGAGAGCSDDGVCFGFDDRAVCRTPCDPFESADTCGPDRSCTFVPGAGPAPVLGLCLPGSDPAVSAEICTEPAGTPCGISGICLALSDSSVSVCLEPCVLSGDPICPEGAACTSTFLDWDGRPANVGVCPLPF